MKSWMNGDNFDNILSRFLYGVIYNRGHFDDLYFSMFLYVSTFNRKIV